MAEPVCRVGDEVTGLCEANAPGHPRNYTGHWTAGSPTSTADGLAIVRLNDPGITDCNHLFYAQTCSGVGQCNGLGIVRVGDSVYMPLGGYGNAVTGSPTTTCL